MIWLREVFGTEKPIIGMCHFFALPGDPDYDARSGMEKVLEKARNDLLTLQKGGIDAVMFSNEGSLPYLTKVENITPVAMARLIGELKRDIKVPFGVNVLWDPKATIDLAVSTQAQFVREVFTGVYASDFGFWNTDVGAVVRHQYALGGHGIRTFFNIYPESAVYMGGRDLAEIARSTVFNARPDALCVSGITAGAETSLSLLKITKEAVPGTVVFANTGLHPGNLKAQLGIADGAIVGTFLKRDGYIWNEINEQRVRLFMEKAREIRGVTER